MGGTNVIINRSSGHRGTLGLLQVPSALKLKGHSNIVQLQHLVGSATRVFVWNCDRQATT